VEPILPQPMLYFLAAGMSPWPWQRPRPRRDSALAWWTTGNLRKPGTVSDGPRNSHQLRGAFQKSIECGELPGDRNARTQKDMRVLAWRCAPSALYRNDRKQTQSCRCYKALEGDGYKPEEFERVYAPMGLEIGALSPEEIAVSIVAELVAVPECGNRRAQEIEIRSATLRPFSDRAGAERSACWPPSFSPRGSSRMGSPKALLPFRDGPSSNIYLK